VLPVEQRGAYRSIHCPAITAASVDASVSHQFLWQLHYLVALTLRVHSHSIRHRQRLLMMSASESDVTIQVLGPCYVCNAFLIRVFQCFDCKHMTWYSRRILLLWWSLYLHMFTASPWMTRRERQNPTWSGSGLVVMLGITPHYTTLVAPGLAAAFHLDPAIANSPCSNHC